MRGVGTVSDVTDLSRIPAIETRGAGGGVELLLPLACPFTGTDAGDCLGVGELGAGEALAAAAVGYGVGTVGVIVVAYAGVVVLAEVVLVLVVLAVADILKVNGPTSMENTTNKLRAV